MPTPNNSLYYGDNLDILRKYIPDESIDLVYLDPPFNSKRNYNVLFNNPKGHQSQAQITAFEDTWHWGEQAEREYNEVLQQPNTDVAEMMVALRKFLRQSDMMAYLTMMANRLLELHRVLKPTGSLYLHCDTTASHYLKLVLDVVFDIENYQNEIIWKRTTAHNDSSKYGKNTDSIFYYTKSDSFTFNFQFKPYDEDYLARFRYKDPDGRMWTDDNATAKGLSGGGYEYEYKGVTSLWRYPLETMKQLDEQSKLHFTKNGGIRVKKYLDESKGIKLQALWDDISPINSQAQERLGYPTQKPLSLLERIITASSNAGDIVLDPFCGCGTAVHAAQKLGRKWIGIDITHLAISLIEKRMKDAFTNITFEVHGTPKDFDSARDLATRNKYEFQWWACSLVNAQPFQGKKKGADGGIDGLIFFTDDHTGPKKIIISVKGGDNVGVTMVKDLIATVEREKAAIGLFVTLAPPTKVMLTEATSAGFYTSVQMGKTYPKIQILTIEGLLNGTQQARHPDFSMGQQTFKQAQKETKKADQTSLLDGF